MSDGTWWSAARACCCRISRSSRGFYFTHSYFVRPDSDAAVAGQCIYGFGFAACYSKDNIHGVQFHPEKSHDAGLELVRNFVKRTS